MPKRMYPGDRGNLHWFGFICISKESSLDTKISDEVIEYWQPSCREESRILADAIQAFLRTLYIPSHSR